MDLKSSRANQLGAFSSQAIDIVLLVYERAPAALRIFTT